MSKRFFVDEAVTDEGKYKVLQEDTQTKERFGVKDFDTKEEAQRIADDMQGAIDTDLSEEITLKNIEIPLSLDDNSNVAHGVKFKDTLQDLKNESSQD
jgi:hypothetical protein